MSVTKGSMAKAFNVKDIYDNEINLEAYKGQKLLLSFYRYASCPFCNLRFMFLSDMVSEFNDHNLKLVAVFQSPKESIMENVDHEIADIPIIPDQDEDLYKLYDLKSSLWGYIKGGLQLNKLFKAFSKGYFIGKAEGVKTRLPADFLIDEEGRIMEAYYGKDISDHLPIETIEALIK